MVLLRYSFCRYFFLFVLFLCQSIFFSNNASAQNHQNEISFIREFSLLQDDLPRESIYLHTDRQWYYFGDRIWFSAYVVSGSHNLPSKLSSVLYVELVSPDGEIVNQTTVKIENGRSKGSITFKNAKSSAGSYQLRAYTAWGLNFGEAYIFKKNIQVFTEQRDESELPLKDEIDVQFFPESGYLINNIPTRVGFKAVGRDGLGKNIKGKIFQNGTEILQFSSEHLGMGSFEFTPKMDANYYAVVEGKQFDLPEVHKEGIVLNVKNENKNQFTLEIKSHQKDHSESFIVFGHVRGEVYYVAEALLDDGFGINYVPKNLFPSGIIHFTVLSNKGSPLAERLVYSKNEIDDYTLHVDLSEKETKSYDRRTRAELNVRVSNWEGGFVPATASLSVFDDELIPYNAFATNIISHLRLETELKGYIEQPGFYFTEDSTEYFIDLLLMTQGWRAYDMSRIHKQKDITLLSMPEKGFQLSGKITRGLFSKPAKDATLVISSGNDHENMMIVTTDEEGRFEVKDLDLQGSETITIRANDDKGGDNVQIKLDEQFNYLPEINTRIPESTIKKNKFSKFIEERTKSTQTITENWVEVQMYGELEDIDVEAVDLSDDKLEKSIRTTESYTQRIDLDDREHLNSLPLLQVLTQIPGVVLNGTEITVRTGSESFNNSSPPLVILDGMEMSPSALSFLPTSQVQTINVFRRVQELAFYGTRGAGGVISIRTRRGWRKMRGLIKAHLEGYQLPTQFYTPKYGVNLPADDERLDQRITLHWEPEIKLDNDGAKVVFWTNDIPSTYRIVIEGMTEDGGIFYQTETFQVK